MEGIRIDFCPHCRHSIDWALDNVPIQDIYIQANPWEQPAEGHAVIPLCEECGRFIRATLHVDGFTIYTP